MDLFDETKVTILSIFAELEEEFEVVVKREGKNDLRRYLYASDFWLAPASSKFHCCFPGGLFIHTWGVYQNALRLMERYRISGISKESVFLSALAHDFCKVDYYVKGKKWYKDNAKPNSKWEEIPYWTVDDKAPLGHGEKSLSILQNLVKVSLQEALAVRHHMGYFEPGVGENWCSGIKRAFDSYPFCFLMHIADLETALSEGEEWFFHQGKKYTVSKEMLMGWDELVVRRDKRSEALGIKIT